MYYLRITDYADELLADLDTLDGWPERVRAMQANWIGKSEGAEIVFACGNDSIKVFSTRPDTLMGPTFMAVAAEHPLALKAARHNAQVAACIEQCRTEEVAEADLGDQEQKGMEAGLKAGHALNGEEVA